MTPETLVPEQLWQTIQPLLPTPPRRYGGRTRVNDRAALRRRGITPRIARRGIESSQRLGRYRCVVERSLAWLVGYRRLQVRYERRADILLGFLCLACALVCLNVLRRPKRCQPITVALDPDSRSGASTGAALLVAVG